MSPNCPPFSSPLLPYPFSPSFISSPQCMRPFRRLRLGGVFGLLGRQWRGSAGDRGAPRTRAPDEAAAPALSPAWGQECGDCGRLESPGERGHRFTPRSPEWLEGGPRGWRGRVSMRWRGRCSAVSGPKEEAGGGGGPPGVDGRESCSGAEGRRRGEQGVLAWSRRAAPGPRGAQAPPPGRASPAVNPPKPMPQQPPPGSGRFPGKFRQPWGGTQQPPFN